MGVAPPLPVQMHGPPAAAQAIYAAEMSFERRSVNAGAAAAYAEFMDPTDSFALMGGAPVQGAQLISAAMGKMMGAGVLAWTPDQVFASTGDLGAVEGHWTFTAKGLPRLLSGHYVTVWRKTPAGAWKGVIDVGTPDT